jgi:hypothetical protein
MALALYDRVQQTGTANTTVSFTLTATPTGYQSFSVVGNGNTTYYSAFDSSGNWEVGVGTYSTGGTLTRTTILSSSNSGSATTFASTVTVFVTQPAEQTVVSSNNPGTSGYVLTSNGSGVAPTWQASGGIVQISSGGTGATTKATAFNALSPMSAAGDIIYGGTSGAGTALAIGTAGQVLTVNSGATAPQYVNQSTLSVGSATTATNLAGGLAGSVPYNTGAGATTFLSIGTAGQVLTVNSGATAPQYVNQSTLSVGTATNVAGGTTGAVHYQSGAGATSFLSIGTAGQVLTVNSGATAPQYVNQSTLSVGSATTSTNIAGGATGSLPYNTAAATTSFLSIGTAGQVLTVNSGATAPQYVNQSTLSVGTATNVASGTANQVVYQSGAGATAFVVAPTVASTFLQWNGTAFAWASAAQTYPGAGIANSTGSAWGTSYSTTGSGTVVALATSPSFTTPVLGTPTSGTLSNCTVDGTDAVGFRNIPINSQSAAYTAVLADSGKVIFHPSTDANARTFTIPSNASVAYAIGTAITFINMTSQVVTIAITTDTMYLSSAGTTGSRSLAQYGSATAIKMTSTTWLISGSGLT